MFEAPIPIAPVAAEVALRQAKTLYPELFALRAPSLTRRMNHENA